METYELKWRLSPQKHVNSHIFHSRRIYQGVFKFRYAMPGRVEEFIFIKGITVTRLT